MPGIRGARAPIRPGVLVKDLLAANGATAIVDLHREYRERVKAANANLRVAGNAPQSGMSYNSFLKVMYVLRRLGLIEWAGEEPMELYPGLVNPMLSIRVSTARRPRVVMSTKVLYQLTAQGQAEVTAWENPYKAFQEMIVATREVVEVLTRNEEE